jgi:hypothetical protein
MHRSLSTIPIFAFVSDERSMGIVARAAGVTGRKRIR